MAQKSPSILYVRSMKDAAGKSYLLPAADIKDLGILVGEKEKVNVYKLISTLEVKGMLETNEVNPD